MPKAAKKDETEVAVVDGSMIEEMQRGTQAIVNRAHELSEITTTVRYTEAVVFLREDIKPARKRLKGFREALLAPLRAVLNTQRTLLGGLDEPLEKAEEVLKAGILTWEKAEEERIAKAEAVARAEAEEAAKAAQEAEAAEMRRLGDEESAKEIEEMEVPVAPPVIVRSGRPAGISITERWDVKVVDIKKLCRAVANGKAPVSAVQPHMSVLRAIANKKRTEFNVPGCEAAPVKGVTAR